MILIAWVQDLETKNMGNDNIINHNPNFPNRVQFIYRLPHIQAIDQNIKAPRRSQFDIS